MWLQWVNVWTSRSSLIHRQPSHLEPLTSTTLPHWTPDHGDDVNIVFINYLIVSTYLTDLNSCGALLLIYQCTVKIACVSWMWVVLRKVIRSDCSELKWTQRNIINKLIYCLTSTPVLRGTHQGTHTIISSTARRLLQHVIFPHQLIPYTT